MALPQVALTPTPDMLETPGQALAVLGFTVLVLLVIFGFAQLVCWVKDRFWP